MTILKISLQLQDNTGKINCAQKVLNQLLRNKSEMSISDFLSALAYVTYLKNK